MSHLLLLLPSLARPRASLIGENAQRPRVNPHGEGSAISRQGRHFAAWEQPQLFSEEMRAGFRSLR
jgi:hypothetical protein